jgi:glycosyltransferase involved in cell wall biosynthesis
MRSLHVAALPFPSSQGTQALLHCMLSALASAGHDTHLLCYAHGADTQPRQPGYIVHRLPLSLGLRSLRSGPSVRKLALDALLMVQLRRLAAALAPTLVVAHHVEAALACHLARVPFVFIAHTSMHGELPSYFGPALQDMLAVGGGALEAVLCARARAVRTVSPLLTALFRARGLPASTLPLPWCVPQPITPNERAHARAALDIASDERVLLYAGNLDRYQGLELIADGVRALRGRERWRLLVATESDPATCPALRRADLPVRFARLAHEADRRLVHAAADVVAVPRKSPGGLPIKLLDALARGARVVATQRACAGLDLRGICRVVPDDDPEAFAAASRARAEEPTLSCEVARAYVREAHAPAQFVAHMGALGDAFHAYPSTVLF